MQSTVFGAGHPEKLLSADGHVEPSGQHWLPPHIPADPGQATASPTEQDGVGVGVGAGGVGGGVGVGAGGVGVGAGGVGVGAGGVGVGVGGVGVGAGGVGVGAGGVGVGGGAGGRGPPLAQAWQDEMYASPRSFKEPSSLKSCKL